MGRSRVLLVSAILVLAAAGARAEDCQSLVAAFNQAADAGREAQAQTLVDKIATDAQCGAAQVAAQRRLAALRLQAVHDLIAKDRPPTMYEAKLVAAEKPLVLWQASATLGETRFKQRRFAEAAQAFDRAIEVVKNESLTPAAPPKAEIEGLVERAGQARLLAATAGRGQRGGAFVKTARNERDGKLGGVYSENVRGVVARAIPVPITFEYRKADFTSVGEEAARELLTAIKEQGPSQIVLVGHTDARGTPEANLKLSQERAEAVANFLRKNGIEAPIEVQGKGASEPARIGDASDLGQDEVYTLNRRVEWVRQ